MARLSTMPTIPDDTMQNVFGDSWAIGPANADPESDYRCKIGQMPAGVLDDSDVMDGGDGCDDTLWKEACLDELIRLPAVLSEHTKLGTAVEMFASGMEGPVVVVTDENKLLGLLTPTHVMRLAKERPVEELEQISMLDVAVPCRVMLEESASPLEAAARFVEKDCDVLVVVGRDGQLAGVLLARDLCLLWF